MASRSSRVRFGSFVIQARWLVLRSPCDDPPDVDPDASEGELMIALELDLRGASRPGSTSRLDERLGLLFLWLVWAPASYPPQNPNPKRCCP